MLRMIWKSYELYHFTKIFLKPTRATIALCQFYQLSQKYWKGLFTTRMNLIRDRDNAMQNLKKLKSHENHKIYCLLRNKFHHKVRKAKRNFVKDKIIAQCRNSSWDLWKTLKNKGISKKQSTASSIRLDIDSKITFDKKIVANTFNYFFTTIAANLVRKLPDISGGFVGPFIDTYCSLKGVKKDSN